MSMNEKVIVQYWDREKNKAVTVTKDTPLPTTGGGSIPDGSIGTDQLADNAVTTEKLSSDAKAPFSGHADEAGAVDWQNVSNKPGEFPPDAHTHPIAQVDGLQDALSEYVKKSGDTLTGPIIFSDPNNRSKIILTKYPDGTGHNNAPTTLDLNSVYLHLGGTEYASNSYRLIGFGYRKSEDQSHASVVAGSQEIDTTGADMGDFIIGTRNSTSDVAPDVIFRVTHDGQIVAEKGDYTPASDKALANKKYVDGVVTSKLAEIDPIADPANATAEDIANAFNSLLAALKG